jgi:hypothetical protein
MSTKTTNLTNKAGETVGTLSFDEGAHSWRIATKAEPNFPSTFPTQQDAFYCWYTKDWQAAGLNTTQSPGPNGSLRE